MGAKGGQFRSCLVECLLSGFCALEELLFAEQRDQFGVVDEQVEFVFGFVEGACGGVDLFGGGDGLGEQASLAPQCGKDLCLDVLSRSEARPLARAWQGPLA